MSFTVQALEFISENYMRNDRQWFKDHKADYEKLVLAPFAELLQTLAPVMEKIDPQLICTPKCVSRIYRDARYVRGGAVFRDSLWCSVRRKKASAYDLVPEFYFYLPRGLRLRLRILPHKHRRNGAASQNGAFRG